MNSPHPGRGCTRAVLAQLRRAGCALTCHELVEALGHRWDKPAVSSSLGNLVRQGRIHRIRLMQPRGACLSAYSIRPVKEQRELPKPGCALAEVFG